jgi:hypothetical protein
VSAAGRKRAVFWATVAGVSILANFGLELVANTVPQLGLKKFAAFTHLGGAAAPMAQSGQ